MSQQLLTESPEKTKQQHASAASLARLLPSHFTGGLHPIAQLQRTLGNRRVAQLIQAKRLTPEGKIIGLQRKLTVGAADDHYEQEADRVAEQVTSMPSTESTATAQRQMIPDEEKDTQPLQTKPLAASITPLAQRQAMPEEEKKEEPPVQMKPWLKASPHSPSGK